MAKNKMSLAQEALDKIPSFEDETESAEGLLNDGTFFNDELKTHQKIKTTFSGSLVELKKNKAKVILQTTHEMSVDEFGLIHSGFIFGAAEYAAIAAVNEENLVIIGCKSKFFAPAKVGDLIVLEAQGRFEEARKREIKVVGFINEIKVFEGLFHAIILENHILKTKIDELQASMNGKDFS